MFWKVVLSAIVRKKLFHMNMCLAVNVYRVKAL